MGRYGIQFEQWTLAGAPDHPVYCNMHSFIRLAPQLNLQVLLVVETMHMCTVHMLSMLLAFLMPFPYGS